MRNEPENCAVRRRLCRARGQRRNVASAPARRSVARSTMSRKQICASPRSGALARVRIFRFRSRRWGVVERSILRDDRQTRAERREYEYGCVSNQIISTTFPAPVSDDVQDSLPSDRGYAFRPQNLAIPSVLLTRIILQRHILEQKTAPPARFGGAHWSRISARRPDAALTLCGSNPQIPLERSVSS